MNKSYFEFSASIIDFEDNDGMITCQFDTFSEVISFLDIVNDFYIVKSLLICRKVPEV